MSLENCASLALIPDHDDDEAHLLCLVHSLFATYTRFLLRIDQASAVASQNYRHNVGKLVGVNDGAGGKCLFPK